MLLASLKDKLKQGRGTRDLLLGVLLDSGRTPHMASCAPAARATNLTAGFAASNQPGVHLVPRPPPTRGGRSTTSQSARARWARRAESPEAPPLPAAGGSTSTPSSPPNIAAPLTISVGTAARNLYSRVFSAFLRDPQPPTSLRNHIS